MVRCTAPWEAFHVLYDGKVKCCCWSKVVVGNIGQQRIADIWNGSELARVREYMARDQLEPICPDWCPRLYDRPVRLDVSSGLSGEYRANLSQLAVETGQTSMTAYPVDFRIFPTNRCNLRCIMCGQDHSLPDSFPLAFQRDLVDHFPYARSILAVGGEPLLSREFRAMLASFDVQRFPDCKFRLITNGTLFDDTIVDLLPGRFDQVAISIDSVSPSRFEQIRRGASWSEVTAAVDLVTTLPNRDFVVLLLFTIMRINYTEIPDFVRFALGRGAVPSLNPVLETWHGQQLDQVERRRVSAMLDALDSERVSHLDGCRAFYRDFDAGKR